MATLAPARVPFGVLDAGKLRTLSNVKNVQNGKIDLNILYPLPTVHRFV